MHPPTAGILALGLDAVDCPGLMIPDVMPPLEGGSPSRGGKATQGAGKMCLWSKDDVHCATKSSICDYSDRSVCDPVTPSAALDTPTRHAHLHPISPSNNFNI